MSDNPTINIFIACSSGYYHNWAINFTRSLKKFAPWAKIHILIINPVFIEELDNVSYYYEYVDIVNFDARISYYQAVRFLRCSEIFSKNELVAIIDADTVLIKPLEYTKFIEICKKITILLHPKTNRWLAGFVTLGDDSIFRNKFKQRLEELPICKWEYGQDQKILSRLSSEFEFNSLPIEWMNFGKIRKNYFITLKGDHKKNRFKEIYNTIISKIR
jgi:hypothetical protein